MDLRLRRCSRDRLGSLPDELICQILSSLLTKDAAVVSLLSRKTGTALTRLTSLDFDDSPISYCARINPQFIHRFQYFKTFVDNVLQSSQSPNLSRFRLKFGGDLIISSLHFHQPLSICGVACFPDLDSAHLNAWIRFPLSRCGIREIDLCIHVMRPGSLPSALFACETLEVLRLDTNLDFEQVSSMPSLRLPNLKVLQLQSILIPEDDFVGRLVSNCPLLKELYMDCWWKYGNSVTISSPSLQKLKLYLNREEEYADFISIDTPNLRYLDYDDLLALHYSCASMKALVEASIHIWNWLPTYEESFHSMQSLALAMSNVQHLSLDGSYMEALDHDELKNNRLPVFYNLTHLEVGHNPISKWDTVLLELLRRSPLLETLEFPRGIVPYGGPPSDYYVDIAKIERRAFRTNQVNPCYLKRVVIKECWGVEREVELIRFLLENVSVLKELLVICTQRKVIDRASIESTLKKLTRASSTCLIIVQ